uniref:Uncharacterized protein n=1 Tax=Anguilla anguilla TaxID=7936 RepID=A0A0E9USH8_ANGAN
MSHIPNVLNSKEAAFHGLGRPLTL